MSATSTENEGGIMMILSPAKTLDLNSLPNGNDNIPDSSLWTTPDCHPEQTKQVALAMKQRSQAELAKLLSVSANLAKTSHQYWQAFEVDDQRPNDETKPSIYAFSGAAYQGLQALELSKDAIIYLHNNLRILDGLYGMLRPLDRMQPYRLEMATKKVFPNNEKQKLHDFWKSAVTQSLSQELLKRPEGQRILLNLASDEYAAAVDGSEITNTPGVTFVKVAFRDQGRVVAVHAKRARGLMARFLAENKASTLDDVRNFNAEGYKLVPKDSDVTTLVFDRTKQSAAPGKRAVSPSAKEKAPAPKRGRKR